MHKTANTHALVDKQVITLPDGTLLIPQLALKQILVITNGVSQAPQQPRKRESKKTKGTHYSGTTKTLAMAKNGNLCRADIEILTQLARITPTMQSTSKEVALFMSTTPCNLNKTQVRGRLHYLAKHGFVTLNTVPKKHGNITRNSARWSISEQGREKLHALTD